MITDNLGNSLHVGDEAIVVLLSRTYIAPGHIRLDSKEPIFVEEIRRVRIKELHRDGRIIGEAIDGWCCSVLKETGLVYRLGSNHDTFESRLKDDLKTAEAAATKEGAYTAGFALGLKRALMRWEGHEDDS